MADIATHSIDLEWKSFNLNLAKIETWMRANAGAAYCGNTAGAKLTLWFTDAPSADEQAAIELYWEALTDQSEEAASYMSAEAAEAAAATALAAKKASAKAKLIALGLSDDEANAIIG